MTFAFGEIVTILRDSSYDIDEHGERVAYTTSRIDVPGCALAPKYSKQPPRHPVEPVERERHGIDIGFTLLMPFGTDIHFQDRVEIHGGGTTAGAPVTPLTAQVLNVDGEPGSWRNAFTGRSFGIEVELRLAVG